MWKGADSGEGCDIQQCKVVSTGSAKLELLIGWITTTCYEMVTSWWLASNLMVKFLQANLQGPFFVVKLQIFT